MVVSPTSRFANVLFANVLSRFANVLGQFPNFFNIINGLKNELYTYVLDFYVSQLKNELYTCVAPVLFRKRNDVRRL